MRVSAQETSSSCLYIRDFKRLHDLAPNLIGNCASRRIFASNGDVLQYSANGLIVKRKTDNWTAFTDGRVTWIDGPQGLVSRDNNYRFPWEHDGAVSATSELAAPVSHVGPESAYPNPALTPGATDPRITQRNIKETICSPLYLAEAQPAATYANRVKIIQIARYGYARADPAMYEEDHFIPVELGGDPDAPSNMWPEPTSPAPGSHEKDQVEASLNEQVCSGSMSLTAAQQAILNDWMAIYNRLSSAKAP